MNNLEHRQQKVKLKILDSEGNPLQNQKVEIQQTEHEFLFGCNGFEFVPYANDQLDEEAKAETEKYIDSFLNIFNFTTLPFYWGQFEAERGNPRTEELKNAARFCQDNDLTVKGHPLSWHTLAPDWLLDLSNQEIWEAQIERLKRDINDFKGLVDMWDVINEVVIMPNFDKYDNGLTRVAQAKGRIKVIKELFDTAQKEAPKTTFILNDFNTTAAYEILIDGCLEAGVEIDNIGIQSHMHQGYWGLEKTQDVLERFGRFGIPIQFSEVTMVSGELMPEHYVDLNDYQVENWPSTPAGEKRQAENVLEFYKTLYAEPLVKGITWWDLIDGQWLNAPSGLLREDYSPKPAYSELKKLIKDEWWTGTKKLKTDAAGQVEFTGTLGDYSLEIKNKKLDFKLEKDQDEISLTLA
ncbi:MAG: endo-1,4-beta-xylanase [Halanaerobium sp.]